MADVKNTDEVNIQTNNEANIQTNNLENAQVQSKNQNEEEKLSYIEEEEKKEVVQEEPKKELRDDSSNFVIQEEEEKKNEDQQNAEIPNNQENQANPEEQKQQENEGAEVGEQHHGTLHFDEEENEENEGYNESQGSQLKNLEENQTNEKSYSQDAAHLDPKGRIENVLILYKNKLTTLKNLRELEEIYSRYWKLVPHTVDDEITKASFMKLFTKIYKILLPIFNYPQIEKFVEGQWYIYAKEKETMEKICFVKSLFMLAHVWCTHVNKFEYIEFLENVFKRITKKRKIKSNTTEIYTPLIKVHIYKPVTKEEYDALTWETVNKDENENITHKTLFENLNDRKKQEEDSNKPSSERQVNQSGSGNESIADTICKERPRIEDDQGRSVYDQQGDYLIYDEEIFYPNEEELNNLGCNEYIKDELLEDDELVILGYPTQFVLNKFINEMSLLESINTSEESQYDSEFYITDYKPYEKHKICLKINDKEQLIKFLKEHSKFGLCRDVFLINQDNQNLTMGRDFVDDECSVHNNLRNNVIIDRTIDMHEIKLQDGSVIKANLENLIINQTYRKAFSNILKTSINNENKGANTKIGIKSELWTQSIEDKLEFVVNRKFRVIYMKLLNIALYYENYEEIIHDIKIKINESSMEKLADIENDLTFFKKFESKLGIKFDNWDSDNDLYDEANKKSPVILVVGPPLIGKTSVAEKLSKDLEMVLLEPKKFFDSIFQKVADFEEKMANWDENEGAEDNEPAQEGEEPKEKPKKQKPGLDTVLNQIELDVYNDIVNGPGVSEVNMQRMYMYILHSDLASSRGVVIDMNSNIYPKTDDPNNDTNCFVYKLLNNYFGEVDVDYVVDLTMNKEELYERAKSIKFNLKTLKNISPREIQLMQKPKIAKKEILEDEIEYDEEGKEVIPEPEPEPELGDEELEKIPKKEDLLEIPEFEQQFEEKYDYYENTQYPEIIKYAENLKTNYYIKVDVTGLDFDEVADLVKARLDMTCPLRPIAKILEGGDFKGLLMDGREGVLPFRKWSPWKQIDPVALKDEFLLLTGSTEFAATYFSRVFLFVSAENRQKFLDNPKKYICLPPKVPINYRVSIIGPPKSGKKTIAKMLSDLYGWKIMDMEDIYEKVKEYQKTWDEPELNSVYTRRVHFSANEFKEVLANAAKKPADRKPDNFVSKIVFMLDALGIPLDKRKTKEQFFEERKYHRDKLAHMFNRMKESEERKEKEEEEQRIALQEEEDENKRLEEEAKLEEELFVEMTECARSQYEIVKAQKHKVYTDHVQAKADKKKEEEEELRKKEAQNPFPAEEEYVIEDLKSDQFYFAFDNDGKQQRVSGIILINHPFSEDEYEKLKDYQIQMDRVIYINDQTDEGIKALINRRYNLTNPNFKFDALDEEKQGAELEKIKAEQAKYEEIITLLKEKYAVNGEECIVEVGYNDSMDNLKLKLENSLNPFSIKIDAEDKVILPADVPPEEKFPLSRGPFGLFCPVIYKEDKWLFYAPEANEVQVNQRVYRISGEKEMEKFKENPAAYLGENGSLLPVEVPPPHIMFTGYQGSGITFYSNILCKELKLAKREIQKEFLEIWEKQKADRKAIRVAKKREELEKQNEEIQQKNKENPESEPEPLVDINDALANDAGLDEEGEDYNAVENDKAIFKSLFKPETPTIYDASWNNMEEKVSTPFLDLLTETRRVPNVMVIFKVSLKTIMDRHFHMDQIEAEYEKMLKASKDKRKQREEELIKQKQQEAWEKLKEEIEQEQQEEAAEAENQEGEENKEGENPEGEENKEEENAEAEGEENAEAENAEGEENKEGENPEGEENKKKKKKKKKRKLPPVNEMKVQLEPEEKDDIWNSEDPDLIPKETLIQQEKDKLSQRHENNVNAITALEETLKERGIPVIIIMNDTTQENVYKNLKLELKPYINNRKNLIEKQLVNNKDFPTPLLLRKVRDLYTNSEVYLQSVYNKLSPVNPSRFVIRTDYPLVYRDRVYLFNEESEKKEFAEYPLDYKTGLECPKDCYPMRGRTIIFTIGQTCSGKTTLSSLLSDYMGFKLVTVKSAFMDLIEKLRDCALKREIEETLYKGGVTNDDLTIKVLVRRITLADLVNENIVIDGFPFTMTQTNFPDELKPDFIFVAECDLQTNIQRALSRPGFEGIPEIVKERMKELGDYKNDIINTFNTKKFDIIYFDTTKSKWYLKDLIHNLISERKKSEMQFARNLSLGKPCNLANIAPKKLRESIILQNKTLGQLYTYSPVALKSNGHYKFNKYKSNALKNRIMYSLLNPENKFHFLTNDEEVKQFLANPEYYIDYIKRIEYETIPPKFLNPEYLSRILFKDPELKVDESDEEEASAKEGEEQNADLARDVATKFSENVKYEYEDCCPVTIVEDKLMKKGKTIYTVVYLGKFFKFLSVEKMMKFKNNPRKYMNLKLKVKKVNSEENLLSEKEIKFTNTVNFLEFTFGSLITKGMLELSKNKIKYPYLDVKESSLKYLALFLKANNPNNNEYEKKKYNEILKDFIKNSKLPFELLRVHENYVKEKDNPLHQKLIKKQLDNTATKYDELMEKAKIQNNTRFENFFRRKFDSGTNP